MFTPRRRFEDDSDGGVGGMNVAVGSVGGTCVGMIGVVVPGAQAYVARSMKKEESKNRFMFTFHKYDVIARAGG